MKINYFVRDENSDDSHLAEVNSDVLPRKGDIVYFEKNSYQVHSISFRLHVTKYPSQDTNMKIVVKDIVDKKSTIHNIDLESQTVEVSHQTAEVILVVLIW